MSRATVLIVEDEIITAENVKEILEADNHNPLPPATTGEEALQMVEKHEPDLVLMDVRLGGKMSGPEAAEVINQKYDSAVVFITAYPDSPSLQENRDFSAYGFLSKPIKNQELLQTVEIALDRYDLQKKLQKRKRNLTEQNKKLRGKNTELKEELDELTKRKKMTFLGQMASRLVHLINNPNTVIQGNAELALEDLQKLRTNLEKSSSGPDITLEKADQIDENLEQILKNAREISGVIQEIKAFIKADETPTDAFKKVDPVEEFDKAVDQIRELCPPDTRCEVNIDESLRRENLAVTSKPGDLKQILINLLKNAIDATKTVEEPWVKLDLKKHEGKLKFVVSDNGSGIEPEEKRKVFDPFYTSKDVGEGTGLGLAIVDEILSRIDGEVRLESTVGEGTTFNVSVPLEDQADKK